MNAMSTPFQHKMSTPFQHNVYTISAEDGCGRTEGAGNLIGAVDAMLLRDTDDRVSNILKVSERLSDDNSLP